MIQRIQSVYLLLTTLFSGLFLTGSFLKFKEVDGDIISISFMGVYMSSGEGGISLSDSLIPLTVILILVPAVSLITIFLFRNRKLQLKAALILIVLIIVLIFLATFYGIMVMKKYSSEIIPGFKMLLPVVVLVIAILAYRGIRKDEEMVRSYDRLR